MKIEEFLYEAGCSLSEKLDQDLKSNNYTQQDTYTATILTRIDTALNLSASVYNSKILKSTNTGVWGIFLLLAINIIIEFI